MLKILFVTGASHQPWMKNMNHFQRVYFLSRQARLTVFGRKGADFSCSADTAAEIVRASFHGKLGVILSCFWWMITNGRSRRFDIILTEPSILCVCGFIGKKFLGAKWVMDVWDIPFRRASRDKRPWWICLSRVDRVIGRFLFRFADLFILSILPHLEFAEFAVPREKMLLLKNAIWMSNQTRDSSMHRQILWPKRPFTILCMRTQFTQEMGLDVLSRAFDILNRTNSNIELLVVGKITDKIGQQTVLLKGRTNVRFREFVDHEELMSLIASSSVCVIPFRNTADLAQTHPIKLLEYLSYGAIVVAPDLPGIASIIRHGDNGLLFRPGDSPDLAEKLRLLYSHPELASKISQRAVALGEEFASDKKAIVILEAFKKLVKDEEHQASISRKGNSSQGD